MHKKRLKENTLTKGKTRENRDRVKTKMKHRRTKNKEDVWHNEIKTKTQRDGHRKMGIQTNEKELCKDQHK